MEYGVDLAAILGADDAFVGFTSGTGAAFGDHDVLNWVFESDYNPVGSVPDGGCTLGLLGVGCAGLLAARKLARRTV